MPSLGTGSYRARNLRGFQPFSSLSSQYLDMEGLPYSGTEAFAAILENNDAILYLRLHWVDLSGLFHTRILPKAQAFRLAEDETAYGIGPSCMISTLSETPLDERQKGRRVQLRPDWTSIRRCTFANKHASVMCFTYYEDQENPLGWCVRTLLMNSLSAAENEHAKSFLVGVEIEFVLLGPDLEARNGIDIVEGWSQTAGLRGPTLTVIEDVVESLTSAGVGVYHFHTELQHQFEIALEPLPPMEALDTYHYAVETLKSFCVARGVRATISPKPLLNGLTNGMHIHLSMSPSTGNEAFLAGVLTHLRGLMCLGAANYDSYVRVGGGDSFGRWVAWGTENGDAPIRKTRSRWELRFPDATANMYLLLAALIHCGLEGLSEDCKLSWADIRMPPDLFSVENLAAMGIDKMLPRSLEESIMCLEEDATLRQAMGPEMCDMYAKIKKKDSLGFSRMSEEERRKWLIRFF